MMIIDDKEYTVKEVAEFLKVTLQTVSNYLRKGELKGQKKGPKKKWFVLGRDINKLRQQWNYD